MRKKQSDIPKYVRVQQCEVTKGKVEGRVQIAMTTDYGTSWVWLTPQQAEKLASDIFSCAFDLNIEGVRRPKKRTRPCSISFPSEPIRGPYTFDWSEESLSGIKEKDPKEYERIKALRAKEQALWLKRHKRRIDKYGRRKGFFTEEMNKRYGPYGW
jgi:hypothetical protein